METVAPKVIQKGERSILGKLSIKSLDLIPLIQKMQAELHNLIADVMQLSDRKWRPLETSLFVLETAICLPLPSFMKLADH